MCWSTDFQPTAINTCDGSEYEDLDSYGSINSYCDENYWAGAKLSCQEKEMELPTGAQLTQLAQELYVKSDGTEATITEEHVRGLKVKDEYKDNFPVNYNDYYFSSEENGASGTYGRDFHTTYTRGRNGGGWGGKGSSSYRAICVSN